MKLAIVTTHPIQYNAPFFRVLEQNASIESIVYFTQPPSSTHFDPGFNRHVEWDINLTSEYQSEQHDATRKSGRQALLKNIKEQAPDAVLIYGWNFPGHFFLMRKLKGAIPVWFRGDSHLIDPLPTLKRWLRRMALTWVYRHVDHCFTVGSNNEDYFIKHGLKSNQLSRAPHAVDNKWFQTDDTERRKEALAWRRALGIPDKDKVILFSGKLEEKKEPELLIKAWQLLDDPTLHLILGGTGILEIQLHTDYAELPNIHLIGFQNQSKMPVLYRMAEVFCLPSKGPNETWGLAINEALACGVPCIASDRVGCARDILANPQLGRVFPSGNVNALKEALLTLLSTGPPNPTSLIAFRAEYSYGSFTKQIRSKWKTTTN